MKRGSLVMVALAGIAIVAAAVWSSGLIERHPPVPAAGHDKTAKPQLAARVEPRHSWEGSDRTFLTEAQVLQARALGLLDRDVKSVLNVHKRMQYGDYLWEDRNVPKGPVWVRVDLEHQLISVYRDGHEIGTAVILYGTDGMATPTGTFPILAKIKDHRSITYDNAPMPYTLRLTDDGVSVHGSDVRWGRATHGCVGVPLQFAKKMFGEVSKGDQVVILSGKHQA